MNAADLKRLEGIKILDSNLNGREKWLVAQLEQFLRDFEAAEAKQHEWAKNATDAIAALSLQAEETTKQKYRALAAETRAQAEQQRRETTETRVRRLEEALLTIAEHERGTWHGQIAERVLSPQEPQEKGASRG